MGGREGGPGRGMGRRNCVFPIKEKIKLKDTHTKNVKFGKEESVSKAKVSDKNTEQATELF